MEAENAGADRTAEVYEGVDFANREEGTGRCFVLDDGKTLSVRLEGPEQPMSKRVGVDCPLGTSAEFVDLLSGRLPATAQDRTFQTRATERWMRRIIGREFQSYRLWDDTARQEFGRNSYFNQTAHVQPTVGMRTVPLCLSWVIGQIRERGGNLGYADILRDARLGRGVIVEAHPRMFLYSMIERVWRKAPGQVTTAILFGVAGYKDEKKRSHRARRESVYHFLREHPEWTGKQRRTINPQKPDDLLFASDHTFDAWLSALTAWAHDKGETIGAIATHDDEIVKKVEIEGHILILDYTR